MEREGEIADKIEKGKMDALKKREKLVHNKCGRDSWSSPQDDAETRGGSIIGLRQAICCRVQWVSQTLTIAMILHLKRRLEIRRVCQKCFIRIMTKSLKTLFYPLSFHVLCFFYIQNCLTCHNIEKVEEEYKNRTFNCS